MGDDMWVYLDDNKSEQGPFSTAQLKHWMAAGAFQPHISTKRHPNGEFRPAAEHPELAPPGMGPPPGGPPQPPPQQGPPQGAPYGGSPHGGAPGSGFMPGPPPPMGGYGGPPPPMGGYGGPPPPMGGRGPSNMPPYRRIDLPSTPEIRATIDKLAEFVKNKGPVRNTSFM